MHDKTYNGWTNYETWVTKLWLDNDVVTYHECIRMARHATSSYELANELKEMIEEGTEVTAEATLYADLLNAAIQEVNFDEIAEAYLEDIGEEEVEK